MRFMRAAGVLLAAFGLQGCAVNPALRISDGLAGDSGVMLDVPFHPQTEYQCGPAALATVLGAGGVPTSPEALAPQVYLPGRQGSLQVELLAATRRAGRIPYVVDRVPEAVWSELQEGRPVLVLQNLWVRTLPRWHYAVVVGADPVRNRVVLNSGEQRGLSVTGASFLRTWDWAGRWGMVALVPGELPGRGDAARYLLAVADFEQVAGAAAAAPAYHAAVKQWPNDPRPHLALGNHAHSGGKQVEAARHYRTGLALAPADPVLGNNLASVLGELGCAAEARAALAAAQAHLPPDSPWRERLEATEKELGVANQPHGPDCAGFR